MENTETENTQDQLNGATDASLNQDQGASAPEDTTAVDTNKPEATGDQDAAAPTPPEETAAPKVIQAAPIIQATVTADPAPTTPFDTMIARIKENGSAAQKSLVAVLEKYIEDLAPRKPQTPDSGVGGQYTLWVTIRNVINNAKVEEFKALWNIVLAFFAKYEDGVFHERYVFRFAEHWRWAKTELDGFQRILNLIKLTADPATRAAGLKQVDMDRVLNVAFTDDGRQRILNFYR